MTTQLRLRGKNFFAQMLVRTGRIIEIYQIGGKAEIQFDMTRSIAALTIEDSRSVAHGAPE